MVCTSLVHLWPEHMAASSTTVLVKYAAGTFQIDFHTEHCGLPEGLFYICVAHLSTPHILSAPFHFGNQISLGSIQALCTVNFQLEQCSVMKL